MKKPLGHVHKWKMTEKQRLAYIEKHPIIPTKRPAGASFSEHIIDADLYTERRKESLVKQGKLVIDENAKKKIHELYTKGETMHGIADQLSIGRSTVANFITRMRRKHPRDWPYRQKRKM